MDRSTIEHINVIKRAINSRKLVVFAGAGVSKDAGIPMWSELVEQLSIGLDLPEGEKDALKVAQMYYNERDEKEYIEKVRQILLHKKTRYQPTHEAILKAKPEHILTTNFDDLFEQVIQEKAYPFSIVSDDKDFPYALNTNLLVKVHGNLDDTSIVLKEDDFLEYPYRHPLMESFIKSVFASKVVLFVGYGFSDPNLKAIIQQVRNILGKNFQYAFILSTAKKSHKSHREYLRKKGVHLIDYNDNEQQILDFLKGNNYLKENYFVDYSISEQGQKLCNFFDLLAKYDPFYESLRSRNFIDQLYDSLFRYDSIVTIDKNFLKNLYPLRTNRSFISNEVLDTDNEELLNLLYNHVVINDQDLKIIDPEKIGISENLVSVYEEKMKYILRKINMCGIFYIVSQVNGNKDTNKYNTYKNIILRRDDCNCLGCRYLRFELSSVVTEVQETEPNHLSKISEDMLLGYMNYKLGDSRKSVQIFNDVAGKAWKSERYISYFIAKKNIKTQLNLVGGSFHLSDKAREKLINDIKEVNTQDLLNQLKSAISAEEHLFLKEIDAFEQLEKHAKKINHDLKEILEAFNIYKRGGRRWGNSEVYSLNVNLNNTFTFYWNNNIVIDEYSNFTKVCEEAFEALIISFATDNLYENKLRSFDYHTLKFMVLYGHADKIVSICNTYKVKELSIDSENKNRFLSDFKNFLNSFFIRRYNTVIYNAQVKKQLEVSRFNKNCSRYLSMFCAILSGTHIDSELEYSSSIADDLMDFLKVADFLDWPTWEYVFSFINSNAHLFTKNHAEKLLALLLDRKVRYRNLTHFFGALFSINNKINDRLIISDKTIIDSLLGMIDPSDYSDRISMAFLFDITASKWSSYVKGRIKESLEHKFSSQLYWEAVSRGLFNPSHYLNEFIEYAKLDKNSIIETNGVLEWNGSKKFLSLIGFIYKYDIKLSSRQKSKLSINKDYIQFVLDPDAYDYSNFELAWLELYDEKIIIDKLVKVKEFKKFILKHISQIRQEELRNTLINSLFPVKD